MKQMAEEKDLQDISPEEPEQTAEMEESEQTAETEETEETAETGETDEAPSTEENQEESEAGEDAEETGDKKLFKKKQKADKKQEAMKEKIDELEDRVKRQMAEFENFRKRTEKEKTAMFETGAKSVIEKILPVVDNFERGLAAIPEEEKGTAFAEGMEMIYKQLMEELAKMEVKPIEAVGEPFNPDFHNAVMQVESEEYESGVVAQELQKGYTYRDSVVRHSMVAVVS
jgi:molecular chaperone GrpE